jgi:hypothetical protein
MILSGGQKRFKAGQNLSDGNVKGAAEIEDTTVKRLGSRHPPDCSCYARQVFGD